MDTFFPSQRVVCTRPQYMGGLSVVKMGQKGIVLFEIDEYRFKEQRSFLYRVLFDSFECNMYSDEMRDDS